MSGAAISLAARIVGCKGWTAAAVPATSRGIHLHRRHRAALCSRASALRAVSNEAAASAASSSSSSASVSSASGFLPINPLLSNDAAPASDGSRSSASPPSSPGSSSFSSAAVRPPAPPVRPTFLRNSLIASVLALCLYLHQSSSSAAASAACSPPASCSCSPPPVSATEEEILELVSRVRLSSEDVVAVYAEVMRRHGRLGLVTLEQYGRVVEDAALKAKEARRRGREERQARREERSRLLLQRQAEQEEAGTASSQEAAVKGEEDEEELQASYWDEQEEQEEKEEQELVAANSGASPALSEARERQLRDSLRRRAFEGWELLCLHRSSLPVTGRLYDVRELCIGLAQLAYDHGRWEEVKTEMQQQGSWKEGRRCSRRERLMLSYRPWKKLELVWRISQAAARADGRLRYDDVVVMVDRMLRTGHFFPRSLLVPCSASALSPHHLLMDANHITYCIFQQLHADSRSDVDESLRSAFQHEPTVVPLPPPLCPHSPSSPRLSSSFLAFDFGFLSQLSPLCPASLLSTPAFTSVSTTPPAPSSASISYAELLSVCRSQSLQGRGALWYLVARDSSSGERAGAIKKRRIKLQERMTQLAWRRHSRDDDRQRVEQLLL